LKKAEVVNVKEVEIKPFNVSDFTHSKENLLHIENVSKKELKRLAKESGLQYSDREILFSKKLIEAYLAKR
jgi:hypothetical protein